MSKPLYILAATQKEWELFRDGISIPVAYDRANVIITGVGGTNVILSLRDIPRDADIINVGTAGSPYYDTGTLVEVDHALLYHPGVDFAEQTFSLDTDANGLLPTADCYTAGDFVTDARGIPHGAVVDMELAYIAAHGFRSLRSFKYISDNLNLNQYELCLKK